MFQARHVSKGEFEPIERLLIYGSYLLVILFFPFSLFLTLKYNMIYERVILFRLGRTSEEYIKGTGLFFYLPCVDMIETIDMRTEVFQIPPQEILTNDSVTIEATAVVFIRVQNPYFAALNVSNYKKATFMAASTVFRQMLSKKTLKEILEDKEQFSDEIENNVKFIAQKWGIIVELLEIKDIVLPSQMTRALASEAEAHRAYKAKIIISDGEYNASEALKKASDVMSSCAETLQLRYLQTLSNIATEQNSTIIFPVPVDIG